MKKKASTRSKGDVKRTKPFPIVAIGASAGGIEAVNQLLKALPANTGMAYVYIQHLDPTHESMLVPILSKATSMNVLQARHLQEILPDQLYIIPPNQNMEVIDGVITLNPRQPKPAINMPIDQFFTSLAEKQKDGAIGILLSGSASDGTIGLKAIKEAGGLTFAQDETAKFQSMPRSAIAEGAADLVLSPEAIAKELERLSKQGDKVFTVLATGDGKEKNATNEINDENPDLLFIIQLLKKAVGVDFTNYKRNTIKRRVLRRMLLQKLETLQEYGQYLKRHANEVTSLYNDLLINVTGFFRDGDTMEYLKKTVLPQILKIKSGNEPLRVWVPGCSTGEEAYSLAIMLTEILDPWSAPIPVQIFATDISEVAISKARIGIYSKSDVANVSTQRLQQFFTRVDGSYRVIKSIRDLCVFAPHNLFKDPPFSRVDLISCCNVLIYLNSELQKKIMSTFYYALNGSGYLVLGKSETVGLSGQLFAQQEKRFKIYMKKQSAGKDVVDMGYSLTDVGRKRKEEPKIALPATAGTSSSVERIVDEILLNRYIPACVVVNQDLEILQFRGSTGFFLEPSPGKASLNLIKMARPGLAFEIRSTINAARKLARPVKKEKIELKVKSTVHHVNIEVVPLRPEAEERLFLVLFEETQLSAPDNSKPQSKDRLVKQLQAELTALKDSIKSIMEDQEASNEELQSANEEIISSNEELQSINEELETSKEEVESANEELITINTELQMRNEQLAETYEYSEALFDTIQEAIIVLGHDFRVKMANRAFYKIYGTTKEETEGILLFELGNKQWDLHALRQMLDEVVSGGSRFEEFEIQHDFPRIGRKTMLMNARKIEQKAYRQKLILLTIDDITEARMAEKMLGEREAWFRSMADNAPVMMWMAGPEKNFTFFNSTLLNYTGRTLEEELNNGWLEHIHPDDREAFVRIYENSFAKRKKFRMEIRLKNKNGGYDRFINIGKPTSTPEGKFNGFIGSLTEL